MWPFTAWATPLTPEQKERVARKCGLALGTLQQCLAANSSARAVCGSLETQVVHCHAEVVAPQLAEEHSKCFRRVVNSKGREPFSACDKHVQAMRAALKRSGLYPFSSSGGGKDGGGASGRQRRKA